MSLINRLTNVTQDGRGDGDVGGGDGGCRGQRPSRRAGVVTRSVQGEALSYFTILG